MAIDPTIEAPIPFEDVPDLPWIPRRRRGRKLHYSTVYRWYQRGVRDVRLEAIRIGGTMCTSEAALTRFFNRLAEIDAARVGVANGHSQRSLDQTADELACKGL